MITDLENPFPGMNPWLQSYWHSVHASLITYARDAISAQLPPGLAALTEERLVIENLRDDFKKSIGPDVAIAESWDGGGPPKLPPGAAVAEAVMVILDKPVERWIQIVDGSGHLITAVEVLSWTNKDDDKGRRAYRSKQRIYQEGGVNLVEIDLLYSGDRIFLAPPDAFGSHLDHPYGVSVWRANQPDRAFAYPIGWRKRLPAVPIPLREQDADAILDLQPVLDETYRNGRYAYLIPYHSGPEPRLPGREQDWAEQLLRERGLRDDQD